MTLNSTVQKLRDKTGELITSVRHMRRRRRFQFYLFLALLLTVAVFSYLTNPFVRFSIIVDPFKRYQLVDGQITLEKDSSLLLRDDAAWRSLGLVKSGWHIVSNRFSRGVKTKSSLTDEVIREIHAIRFNPEEPYLISGDHFSVLYPRSLGIFYHTLLDPRTALDAQDWQNRQLIYLKTTAYALQAYEQSDRLSTTIVPVGPRSVVLANIYAPPSDTLYSLLYALSVLKGEPVLSSIYSFAENEPNSYAVHTQQQANQLLADHGQTLRWFVQKYVSDSYDPATGLIKREIELSGVKDIAQHRASSFYDNVVFWRTVHLAQQLGLVEKDEAFLAELKQRILDTFWLPEDGYFLEDLSEKGVSEKRYCSDWLIVLATGFLNPLHPDEASYYQRTVEYIQRNGIDQPFALQYHPDVRREQLNFLVRTFAPAYGSTAIWSHWGMEYIKVLTFLARQSGDAMYLEEADRQLAAYTFNIKRYRGFPEVYNQHGDFFNTVLYKSVRRTGWIINYEQTRALFEWTREKWPEWFIERVLTSVPLAE